MTNNTQNDPMQAIDKALENFDISQFHSLNYEQIQEVADQYLSSKDESQRKLGQELKEVDPSLFQLTPAEESTKRVREYLLKAGKTEEEADKFSTQILATANQETVGAIVGSMNANTYREWATLNEYSPNILQQLYLLNVTAKMLLKKSYDDIYEESLHRVVKFAISILSNSVENAKLASKLTPEQASSVMVAFNASKFEIAIQLIYKFVKENE